MKIELTPEQIKNIYISAFLDGETSNYKFVTSSELVDKMKRSLEMNLVHIHEILTSQQFDEVFKDE